MAVGISPQSAWYGASVERLKLPIGLQTFRRLREEGHYYVDKTPHLLQLVKGGAHYFLSRPRRFGKSLLLDTVKDLFEGRRELFEGLAADGAWKWDARHPVVRIDFGAGSFSRPGELETRLDEMLTLMERAEGIDGDLYELGYPNREVREGLNGSLLRHLTRDPQIVAKGVRLYDLLEADDIDGLKELIHGFYAGIPHEWYTNNDIATYEGYYAAVFYAYFVSAGLDARVEDSTNRGRLDMAVRFGGSVFVFEFKVVEQAGAGTALAQLRSKGYAEKYRGQGESVYLVGVEFSSTTRNIERFDVSRGCSD